MSLCTVIEDSQDSSLCTEAGDVLLEQNLNCKILGCCKAPPVSITPGVLYDHCFRYVTFSMKQIFEGAANSTSIWEAQMLRTWLAFTNSEMWQ